MKIKAEDYYLTTDGKTVGPMRGPNPYGSFSAKCKDGELRLWNEDGSRVFSGCIGDIIAKARNPDHPRAAHKLDLKPGDVVELVGWQDGSLACIGDKYTVDMDGALSHQSWPLDGWIKGQRPLFRVISRAADTCAACGRDK